MRVLTDNFVFGYTGIAQHEEGTPSSSITVKPNPARHAVNFSVPALAGHGYTIKIFEPTGRLIKTLSGAEKNCRWNLATDEGIRVAPGVYFYVYASGAGSTQTGRLVVCR